MSYFARFGQKLIAEPKFSWGVAAACGVVPTFSWLSAVVVGLVALRLGAVPGFYVLIFGLLPEVVISFFATPKVLFAQFLNGVIFVYAAALILRNFSLAYVYYAVLGVGVATVSLVYSFFPQVESWWLLRIADFTNWQMNVLGNKGTPFVLSPEQKMLFSQFATGLMTAVMQLFGLTYLFIARSWQALMYHPSGFKLEFNRVRLAKTCALFCVSVIFFILFISRNNISYLPVLVLPLFLAGLGYLQFIVESYIKKPLLKRGVLFVLYLSLIFSFHYMIFLWIAVCGVAGSFLDVRKEFLIK